MACPMIKIQSSDGQVFDVDVQVAKLSSYFKNMLDDLGVEENEVIPIPQNAPEISGAILKRIIQWANHHKDDTSAAEDDDKEVKPTDDMSSWDAEFLQVDQSTLFQMIRAADYLNIGGLLDVTCKKVAKMIKGKTAQEVRRMFHIQNDFSPEEEQQVRIENSWCDDRCVVGQKDVHRTVVGKIPSSSIQFMQVDGNESFQVILDCLNTSVVLRKIFQHFSDRELLEISCVNKSWNSECRILMKKRGKLMGRLVCSFNWSRYNNIEAFGASLRHMNVIPYSGVFLEIEACDVVHEIAALDSTCEEIFTRLTLEHLSVRLLGDWWEDPNCFLFAKNLLQDFSGVLKILTFDISVNQAEFIQHIVQDCTFPRLTTLKLLTYQRYGPDESYTSYIKPLVLRAPNLKELYIHEERNLMVNILEGSSAVLVYEPMVKYPFDQISDSVMSTIRLEKIKLVYSGPEMDFERFHRTIPKLLTAPCTSRLRELWIDEILAVPLLCYGISLKNVKKLQMDVCLEPFYPMILGIVMSFDFTRIFPNLNEVCIRRKFTHFEFLQPEMSAFVEQAIANLREPKLDRAANIKELNLGPWSLSNETAPFFAEMFPNIEKLGIKAAAEEISFGSIWQYWVDLKELQVTWGYDQIANLDSAFCGIFPEEVAELRQKDDEFLKTVNIVPVMPTITGLKNLKILKLKFKNQRWDVDFQNVSNDNTFVFSKVTGFIAFERCPSLTVGLEFWCENGSQPATRHLEPFTSVTIEIPS